MKKIFVTLSFFMGITINSQAGLITHNDYTDGSVITAAGQNTNENTIFNEFNGNIDNTNIKSGGIATANIANNAITYGLLDSTTQSTFTYVNNLRTYRRPVLVWDSQVNLSTGVYVENNTGTSNQTCILFPDDYRCVTETINNSATKRRVVTTVTASASTPQSGMAPGETVANNTWYSVYAWKASDGVNYVLVLTTNTPTQSNYATLNTILGKNSWVYLGMVLNGDGYNNANTILKFTQSGFTTMLINNAGGSNDSSNHGALLANNGATLTLTWTYGTGTNFTNIPSHLKQGSVICSAGSTNNILKISDSAGLFNFFIFTQSSGGHAVIPLVFSDGIKMTTQTGNEAMDIHLYRWEDSILASPFNAQL